MFPLALATVLAVIFATVDTEHGALQTRHRRQYSYSLYYFCGSYPNQYLSYYPCPCTNCGSSCQHRCSTTMYCQTMDISSSCVNGCCTRNRYPPITSTSMRPTTNPPVNPLCEGREVSGGYCRAGRSCPTGFTCTANNVCCRCAYGTSIGPCVNSQCPTNFQCNENNECCPYQV